MESSSDSKRLLTLLSRFLWESPDAIDKAQMDRVRSYGVSTTQAYSMLLAAHIGLDIDSKREGHDLFSFYFPKMVSALDPSVYQDNPYIKNIVFKRSKLDNWDLAYDEYKPYEAFVMDDFVDLGEGRYVPRIGFFETGFRYPAVYQDHRLWMSVTPNEINTMADPIKRARGRVLACGLGMGYFAYMASMNDAVEHIDVYEIDPDCIKLFNKFILPSFSRPEKISIIQGDAIEKVMALSDGEYAFAFVDLWRDVSDGLPIYRRLKPVTDKFRETEASYWIEKTMDYYL